MQFITNDIATICLGQAASAAAVLLAAGTKGKRLALPHARVLLHQPYGQVGYGQVTDLELAAKEILRMRDLLEEILSHHTGQPIERIHTDTDRDFVMEADEALEYGIIDEVISLATRSTAPVRSVSAGQQGRPVRGEVRGHRRAAEVLVLRQVAEAGQEAHRRPGRLHLRRVHRPLQRDHRGGAHRDRRAPLRRAAQRPARSATFLDDYVVGQDAGQEDPVGRRLQPLQAHPVPAARTGLGHHDEVELAKSNILLLGPTGCGKTLWPRRWPACSTCRSPSPTPPRSPRPATSARTSRTSCSS